MEEKKVQNLTHYNQFCCCCYGPTYGIWKLPGQESSWRCSCSLPHSLWTMPDPQLNEPGQGWNPHPSQRQCQVLNLQSHNGNSASFFFLSFIEVYLIYNFVIISAVQHSDLVINIYTCILFQIIFPHRPSQCCLFFNNYFFSPLLVQPPPLNIKCYNSPLPSFHIKFFPKVFLSIYPWFYRQLLLHVK